MIEINSNNHFKKEIPHQSNLEIENSNNQLFKPHSGNYSLKSVISSEEKMKDLMINEQKNVEIIPKENFLKEAISNDQIILKNHEKKHKIKNRERSAL